jgi:hypothetical protein
MRDEDDLELRAVLEPHWFRVEASREQLRVSRFSVVRHTPKGAWLKGYFGEKFVLRNVEHRGRLFAAPTHKQAEEDFRLRKLFRIRMLEVQLDRTQRDLDLLRFPEFTQI